MKKNKIKILLITFSFISLFFIANKVSAYTFTRVLQNGMQGSDVTALQQALGITADGIFGPSTLQAVKDFQTNKGLTADGVVGTQTLSAIPGSTVAFANSSACTGDYCYTWLGQNILVDPNSPVNTGNGIADLLGAVYRFGIAAAVILALIMIIWGGIEYMTSDAWFNKEEAKKKINDSLMGLGLALISYVLLYIINPCLVNFNLTASKTNACTSTNTFLGVGSLPPVGKTDASQSSVKPETENSLDGPVYYFSWSKTLKQIYVGKNKYGEYCFNAGWRGNTCMTKGKMLDSGILETDAIWAAIQAYDLKNNNKIVN